MDPNNNIRTDLSWAPSSQDEEVQEQEPAALPESRPPTPNHRASRRGNGSRRQSRIRHNQQRLAANRRMGFQYKNLDRKPKNEVAQIRRKADSLKDQLTADVYL